MLVTERDLASSIALPTPAKGRPESRADCFRCTADPPDPRDPDPDADTSPRPDPELEPDALDEPGVEVEPQAEDDADDDDADEDEEEGLVEEEPEEDLEAVLMAHCPLLPMLFDRVITGRSMALPPPVLNVPLCDRAPPEEDDDDEGLIDDRMFDPFGDVGVEAELLLLLLALFAGVSRRSLWLYSYHLGVLRIASIHSSISIRLSAQM